MLMRVLWIIIILTAVAVGATLVRVFRGRKALGKSEAQELQQKRQLNASPPVVPAPDEPTFGMHRDVLWGMFEKHLDTAQHHEEQRERVTGLLLVLEVAILGLLAFKEGEPQVAHPIYLTLPLAFLGLFGALFSLKHYERYRFHTAVAGSYRRRLDEFVPAAMLGLIFLATKREHQTRYGFLSKLQLYYFWTALHLGVATLGLVLALTLPNTVRTREHRVQETTQQRVVPQSTARGSRVATESERLPFDSVRSGKLRSASPKR